MSLKRPLSIVLVGFFWIFSGNSLFAQSDLETMPVFYNGRVMPLHTYARKVVREICGTEHPFFIRDDAVIADFNQVIATLQKQDQEKQDFGEFGRASTEYRFLNPGATLDGGVDRYYSIFKIVGDAQQIQTALPIQGLSRKQIEQIDKRVRQLVPVEGRYFEAVELLISWIYEPEVWAYIPIFLVPEAEYLNDVFDMSPVGDRRTSQHRVSLHQLRKSQRFKQRSAEAQWRKEFGQHANRPIMFDPITEQLRSQSQAFLELTFHPQRQLPTRMLELLTETFSEESSYIFAMDAWSHLLSLGEIPGRQAIERGGNPGELMILHPTTQRWHEIVDKMRFLTQIYGRTDSFGNPILPNPLAVEQQYEILIGLIDTNLAEAAALMEMVYPGVSYRLHGNNRTIDVARLLPELSTLENQEKQTVIRKIAISYYYLTKKLRNEIETAYLALYDNGLSFRFLPLASPLVLEMGITQNNLNVQPWASAAMILGSGETFINRFFKPELTLPKTNTANRDIVSNTATDEGYLPVIGEAEETGVNPSPETPVERVTLVDRNGTGTSSLERDLFQTLGVMEGNICTILAKQCFIGTIRANMRELMLTYSVSQGKKSGDSNSNRICQFRQAVHNAATPIERMKKSFVDEENKQMTELLAKTAYPDSNSSKKLLTEYRYNRLHPFYWMGVFALIALLLNSGTYIIAATRDKSVVANTVSIHAIVKGKSKKRELSDYTNSIEEWFFISSIGILMLAIMIAFIGGVMRAKITGWIPITNMYETTVMMALSSAVLGMWYALSPLLYPALQLAWLYSRFPNPGTLREWFVATKMQKTVTSSTETEGETAMREAAEEFGVPGGMAMEGCHSAPQRQTPEAKDAQQRVNASLRALTGQCLLAVPRLIMTFVAFYWIVVLANGTEYVAEHKFFVSAANVFAAADFIELITVIACVGLMLWYIPHALLALLVMPVVLCRPAWIAAKKGIQSFEAKIVVENAPLQGAKSQAATQFRSEMSRVLHKKAYDAPKEPKSIGGVAWLKQARNAALERKLFIAVTASLVCVVALIAGVNRTEFNPDIRPIAAVLRSNFWFAVHVLPIVASYAAAFIAWGIAAVSLGYVIFGRYQRTESAREREKTKIQLPAPCQMFTSVIERLLQIALGLLIVGTVLGARWADYSWGRFWSWDPKEVWALITILFFVIVFHGKAARYYGAIGTTVGALFASITVIITWYGVNFVFEGSIHAYGGGTENNAKLFLLVFIAANLLWGILALLRYIVEVYGSEVEE